MCTVPEGVGQSDMLAHIQESVENRDLLGALGATMTFHRRKPYPPLSLLSLSLSLSLSPLGFPRDPELAELRISINVL